MHSPLIERGDAFVTQEMVAHVCHRRQDRQPVPPSRTPAPCPVQSARPGNVVRIRPGVQERDNRFGDHEPDVLVHAFLEPPQTMLHRIPGFCGHIDVDATVLDFDRIYCRVVGKKIEGAAAPQIETGVVPVTGQDTVLDGSAMQGEPHVGTAVVDRVEFPLRAEEDDRDRPSPNQDSSLVFDLVDRSRVQPFPCRSSHGFLLSVFRHPFPWFQVTEAGKGRLLDEPGSNLQLQVYLKSRKTLCHHFHTTLTIGDVAARSGVATSALRFYEAEGLITSERTGGNQRRYRQAVLRRVAVIRAAQRIGVPLREIRSALDTLPHGRTPNKRTGPACRGPGGISWKSGSRRSSG